MLSQCYGEVLTSNEVRERVAELAKEKSSTSKNEQASRQKERKTSEGICAPSTSAAEYPEEETWICSFCDEPWTFDDNRWIVCGVCDK